VAAMTRDPDRIQREIEQTRAELAETIDAIADRISPRRVAGRGAAAVKAQVAAAFGAGADGDSATEPGPYPGHEATRLGAHGAHTAAVSDYAVSRRLRTDRVLVVVGVAAAVAALLVLRRSRR
jgi:Protein of unknown function (DUF3618)